MEKQIQKLESSLVEKLKELNTRKNELIVNTGQLHLEIKQLEKLISVVEFEFEDTNKQLNSLLSDLEKQYPNGEIDLLEGTVTF
jgi:DNA repair exonuclease SbcCD ATPase subunit